MAAIDVSAHVALELGQRLDRLDRSLTGLERAMARPPAQPFSFRPIGEAVSPSSGDVVLDLGGPANGRWWQVMQWTIGGRLWSSTAGGVGLLVVSATPPVNAASVGIALVNDVAAASPAARTLSRGQVSVRSHERLYIVVTGPAATTEYVGAANVEQYEEGERVQAEVT